MNNFKVGDIVERDGEKYTIIEQPTNTGYVRVRHASDGYGYFKCADITPSTDEVEAVSLQWVVTTGKTFGRKIPTAWVAIRQNKRKRATEPGAECAEREITSTAAHPENLSIKKARSQ